MQKIRSIFLVPLIPLLALAVTFQLLSCGNDGPNPEVWTDVSKTDSYSGSGDQVILVDTTGNVNLTYTLDLGANTRDVYFIFTNTTMSDAGSNPVVKSVGAEEPDPQIMSDTDTSSSFMDSSITNDIPAGQRGTQEISEFNRNPFAYITNNDSGTMLKSMITAPEPLLTIVGDETPFFYDKTTNSLTAVCRHIKTANSKTLYVWREKTVSITDTQIQNIGNKFLNDGTSDDIYEWVTNIFGVEWGTWSNHNYDSQLITPTNEIHILIYDMATHDPSMANVIGFFWGKDNFKSSSISYSNQKIMFYINSSFVTTSIEDVYSTLAHEFQHMINFYQKNVLRVPDGSGPETWLNEMCSMVAEDLVSTKIQVDGPRGVSYLLGTAGVSGNTKGRLPLYNCYNYISLTNWLTLYPDVLRSYSINYAFGAYLSRNFGGAPFFQKLVQNSETDYKAINYALTQSGINEDFASVMRKWAAANLLSDRPSPPAGYYQYNSGNWFTSTINSINYDLGSINLYNYLYSGQSGPRYYTSTIPAGKEAASNVFFRVGTGLKGTVTRSITMEDNIKLTVVVKVP